MDDEKFQIMVIAAILVIAVVLLFHSQEVASYKKQCEQCSRIYEYSNNIIDAIYAVDNRYAEMFNKVSEMESQIGKDMENLQDNVNNTEDLLEDLQNTLYDIRTKMASSDMSSGQIPSLQRI